jgi:hypothetical protein
VISTPNAEKETLPEFVLAATIAPEGKPKLSVRVAASDAGITPPRITNVLAGADEEYKLEGITIKLYEALLFD